MTIEQLYAIYKQYPSIQTDTRKLKEDDFFFALKGEKFNGNTFVDKAFEAGAAYAVIDEEKYAEFGKTILVENVLDTLQQLASHHREQFKSSGIPFIAITGSNGKTTTKELIHAVLSSTYKTYTTEGNLNNHIGVPLTLLKIKNDAEMAVIEMGANHPGEIASYCNYTMPTHGLITNSGKAHLEGFGSEEGVRKAKGELFDYLRLNDGTAFIMNDYDYLVDMSKGIPKLFTYGSSGANIKGQAVQNNGFLRVSISKGAEMDPIQTHLIGDYNLPNVLAAVAVGKYFHVTDRNIKESIENYFPSNSRSQLIEKGTNKIILDAYNANPTSMKMAIENFAGLDVDNKVLLLGSMAELGAESVHEHELLLDIIKNYHWKDVVLVGGDFLKLTHPYIQFNDAATVKEWFKSREFTDTWFLLKGSRSMQMEKIISD